MVQYFFMFLFLITILAACLKVSCHRNHPGDGVLGGQSGPLDTADNNNGPILNFFLIVDLSRRWRSFFRRT